MGSDSQAGSKQYCSKTSSDEGIAPKRPGFPFERNKRRCCSGCRTSFILDSNEQRAYSKQCEATMRGKVLDLLRECRPVIVL